MFGSRIRPFRYDILLNKKRESFVLINRRFKKKSNTVTVKKKGYKTKGTKQSTKKIWMKQDASLNLTGIKKNDVFLNKLN